MKKVVLILMLIVMVCITGCGSGKSEKVNQKIVLIYSYINYAETPTYRGFYVNGEGDKIQFDFSETAKSFREENKFISDDEMYQFLIDTKEIDSEEFLSSEEISKCYKLLSKIKDDYDIDEKCVAKDAGSHCWYGVLDNGKNPPEFILLSEKGDWEGVNTDKNAKQIMKILEKAE